MGFEPSYIVIDGQTFSKVKLALDNHISTTAAGSMNCSIPT